MMTTTQAGNDNDGAHTAVPGRLPIPPAVMLPSGATMHPFNRIRIKARYGRAERRGIEHGGLCALHIQRGVRQHGSGREIYDLAHFKGSLSEKDIAIGVIQERWGTATCSSGRAGTADISTSVVKRPSAVEQRTQIANFAPDHWFGQLKKSAQKRRNSRSYAAAREVIASAWGSKTPEFQCPRCVRSTANCGSWSHRPRFRAL